MHESFVRLATRLIAANGRDLVLRETSKSSPEYFDPTNIKFKETTVKGVQVTFKTHEVDGVIIKASDVMFLIDSKKEIDVSMKIHDELNSKTYDIEKLMIVAPGETKILYKIQARV